jgi:hypothetical protein
MKGVKRQSKRTYTPRTSKKLKQEPVKLQQKIYYSDTFDLFNYSDIELLKSLISSYPNCILIVGIEDSPSPVLTVEQVEDSLKQTGLVSQVLYPAPSITEDFFSTFQIDFICTTDPSLYPSLPPSLVKIIDYPKRRLRDDLISRVLSKRSKFVSRCFDKGYSRRQLGISLLEELSIKFCDKFSLIKASSINRWRFLRRPNFRFLSRCRSFFSKVEAPVLGDEKDLKVVKDFQT